jgi:hypothetical protein
MKKMKRCGYGPWSQNEYQEVPFPRMEVASVFCSKIVCFLESPRVSTIFAKLLFVQTKTLVATLENLKNPFF